MRPCFAAGRDMAGSGWGDTRHRPRAPAATFYLALTRLTDGGWAEWRTYDLLRKSVRSKVSGRRALMFLGKPRNAR